VGAGLTGCTLAHRFAGAGLETVLLERAAVPGGLIRSEHMNGVLHEPHGSHIFHTEDQEVREPANATTPFNDYRHRVDILADGKVLNWPILLSDIERRSQAEESHSQLDERRGVDAAERAQAANSEEWCLGWPGGPNGYTDLIEGLLDDPQITVHTRTDVTLETLDEHVREHGADLVVLTCPLDVFCGGRFGRLDWRGIDVRSVHVPHKDLAQGAMVLDAVRVHV
jgi:UDP-galactopyranose mutase